MILSLERTRNPTGLKAGLKRLEKRGPACLLYTAGLEGWDFRCDPALYIIGFFSVLYAGLPEDLAKRLGRTGWKKRFSKKKLSFGTLLFSKTKRDGSTSQG